MEKRDSESSIISLKHQDLYNYYNGMLEDCYQLKADLRPYFQGIEDCVYNFIIHLRKKLIPLGGEQNIENFGTYINESRGKKLFGLGSYAYVSDDLLGSIIQELIKKRDSFKEK